MSYTIDTYLITCLTNMHVGSGEANFGVIDNLVQRDSITEIPTINASSLKGALRQFFCNSWKDDKERNNKLNHIFGPDSTREKDSTSNIGHYKFFSADLLVLPVRSNKKTFYRATAKMLIDTINQKATAFGNDNKLFTEIEGVNTPTVKEEGVILEDWNATSNCNLNINNNYLGNNVAIFDNDNFKELAKNLPVIARNVLDNGVSKNLWYEEVVPRESRFVFFVAKDDKYANDFDYKIAKSPIQIGANASIGYGYCSITKITNNEQEN